MYGIVGNQNGSNDEKSYGSFMRVRFIAIAVMTPALAYTLRYQRNL